MSDTLIKVEGLYKKFCMSLKRSMYYGTTDAVQSMFGIQTGKPELRKNEFWALQDINFELKRGETLGIIGVNGSGKSTLLRLLNGIYPPDAGKIEISGRIGALIAVSAGFHPQMSGRENIYLNGTILGMSRKEIEKKFDKIINFAEIGEFLDAPVATYSSGMTVRLGFAIAIHCEPDILLVDEILSVGDLSFRNKSLRKMAEFREKANGLIFISHNLEHISTLCQKVLVLNKGQIIFNGDVQEGIVLYEELTRKHRVDFIDNEIRFKKTEEFIDRISSGSDIDIVEIGILDKENNKCNSILMSDPLVIYCDFSIKNEDESLYFSVSVRAESSLDQVCIWVVSKDRNKASFKKINNGKYRISVTILEHHLSPNVYIPSISIRNNFTGETYERILSNYPFRVISEKGHFQRGVIAVDEEWSLKNTNH